MKTSLIASIIIASLFFQIQNVLSQPENNFKPVSLYIKGSYNYSYRSSSGIIKINTDRRFSGAASSDSWEQVFGGTIGYQYSKTLQLEFNYSFAGELGLYDSYIRELSYDTVYHSYRMSSYRSNEITLRANIFPNPDRGDNPVYFVGGFTIAVQPVKNTAIDEYKEETLINKNSYTRFSAGPLAGVGIYWDFGYISFATEFTFSARYSVGRKEISEASMNFTFSPVIKL